MSKRNLNTVCKNVVFLMLPSDSVYRQLQYVTEKQIKLFGLIPKVAVSEKKRSGMPEHIFQLADDAEYALALFPQKSRHRKPYHYNSNVCFELGYFKGKGKWTKATALVDYRVRKDIPTDFQDIPYQEFDGRSPASCAFACEEALLDRMPEEYTKNWIQDSSFEIYTGLPSRCWKTESNWAKLKNKEWFKKYLYKRIRGCGRATVQPIPSSLDRKIYKSNNAVLCSNKTKKSLIHVSQHIKFHPPYRKVFSFGGYVKIMKLGRAFGVPDRDCAIHLHLAWGNNGENKVTKHIPLDLNQIGQWQFVGDIIRSDVEVDRATLFCVFRSHAGDILFDNLFLRALE